MSRDRYPVHRSSRHSISPLRVAVLAVCLIQLSACVGAPPIAGNDVATDSAEANLSANATHGLVRVEFPNPDPGAPMYARLLSQLNQVYHTSEWAVIPFYRSPEQIPAAFNLLSGFDFPGSGGPGAFAAPLLVAGFYMVEAGAPLGTFPRISISKGDRVPMWFIPWPAMEAAIADNQLTMAELESLSPLKGVGSYTETLRPRVGEHLVVFDAKGVLSDGRKYDVHFTHVEERATAAQVRIR